MNNIQYLENLDKQISKARDLLFESLKQTEEIRSKLFLLEATKAFVFIQTGEGKPL